MPIEKVRYATREEWLALRKQDVTASVAAALLGCHPYLTAYGLWALKVGKITDDEAETPAMRRGRLLEPVAVELLREMRPEWALDRNGFYYRDPDKRLGATPDVVAFKDGVPKSESKGVVQIKSVERSVFRRTWREEGTGEVEPPLWIAIQAIVEAHLTGAQWAAVAALVVGHGIDLEIIDVPIHEGIIDRVTEATREFWEMVDAGKTPDIDWKRDASLAARLIEPAGAVDLSGDNVLPSLLARREDYKRAIKSYEEESEIIDAEIKSKLGGAAVATLPGWKLTFKRVKTKPYTVPGRVTRPLKVHRTKENEK